MLVSDYESPETKLFKAGLKHYKPHEERLIKGTRRSPNHDYHDLIDYERVDLMLSRVALSIRDRAPTSTSTSTTCTEASRNGWSTDTSSVLSTVTDLE
jgi:hypothetical protein